LTGHLRGRTISGIEATLLGAEFPRDPADRLIAATARVHGLRLLTADERFRRSGLVSVV